MPNDPNPEAPTRTDLNRRLEILEDGRWLRAVAWIAAMLILAATSALTIYLVLTGEQRSREDDYTGCIADRSIIAELHTAYATSIKVDPDKISDPNLKILVIASNKNQAKGFHRVKRNQILLRCKPILDGHDPVPMTAAQRRRFLARYLANVLNPFARKGVPEILPRKRNRGGGVQQSPNQGGQLQGPTGPKGPEGPPGKPGTTPVVPPQPPPPAQPDQGLPCVDLDLIKIGC